MINMDESTNGNGVTIRGRRKRNTLSNHWHVTEDEPQVQDTGPHWPMYPPRVFEDQQKQEELLKVDQQRSKTATWADLKKDYSSIALLLFLYLLQGIPLGLTASIPLVLQSRHVSYAQQAVFSFAYWPFSLKLLWAPIVDSFYSEKIGRRKSWLIPTQYLLGVFMLILSHYVSQVIGDGTNPEGKSTANVDVVFLTVIFFGFNFLAATQDIAVDGWALTMLSKRNVGYASTCNAVGQTAGYFLGNVVFLALESTDFCNRYLRSAPQDRGVVTLADFVYFWGWVYLVTTTVVFALKREVDHRATDATVGNGNGDSMDDLGVRDTYKLLWKIVRLKPVLTLVGIHLTAKMGFAAADGITGLKLVELGVPKDKMALLAIPIVPLQIILPWVIGRYTAGPRPLDIFLKAYPFRLILGLGFMVLVYWTPSWRSSDGSFPATYYLLIVAVYCVHQVFVYSIFVAVMAFHAQISDPLVGGTYMTLMNTMTNLGGNWPVTLALSVVDDLTWKHCLDEQTQLPIMGDCSTRCGDQGGYCSVRVDGYYILSAGCAIVGFLWWRITKRKMDRLQDIDKKDWSCTNRR